MPRTTMLSGALVALTMITAAPAAAQDGIDTEPRPMLAESLPDVVQPVSPHRLSWTRDGLIFAAAGIGLVIADGAASERSALTEDDLARFDRADVPWFDRSATHRYSTDLIRLSEQIGSPLALAPLALLADPRIRADWQALGVMYIQTTLLSAATSTVAKETITRYRPYVYNSDLSYDQRTEREPGGAFFSSAATSAFAQAVLLATVFSDHRPDSPLRPYVWGASLAAAGTVGYLRYASGIHYPSDIVVGALVGSAIGYAVPRLHRVSGSALSISPEAGPRGAGLSANITF
jgi:membrane-associated phospholipid phosphatase